MPVIVNTLLIVHVWYQYISSFFVDIEMGFVPDDCEHLDDYLFKYSH